MKRLLILVCMAPLFAACDGRFIKDEFLSSECRDDSNERLNLEGYTVTAIAYGDSHLVVVPVSEIRPNSEFRFKLLPERKKTDEFNWANAWVQISSEDDEVGDTEEEKPSNWLNVAGSHSGDDGWLIACVPDLEEGRVIKYKVSVSESNGDPELGMLDPRADLIPE